MPLPPHTHSVAKSDKNNDVHIFYCANDGNAMPTCTSIASVLDNAGDEKIHIHIVSFQDNKMSQENISKIESLKKSIKNFELDFVYFDKTRLNEFNTQHWNKAIMVKLFAAELFPNLKRIIWLDDDTIVLKSLKDLYNMEMNGKYLAGVEVSKEYNKNFKKNCKRWITAGIGLYNLEKMRKDNAQESLLKSAKKYRHRRDNCGGVEEYALTYGLPKNKVYKLPYSYSIMVLFEEKKNVSALSNYIMLHYTSIKPWKFPKRIKPIFYNKWKYYFNKTEYSNVK